MYGCLQQAGTKSKLKTQVPRLVRLELALCEEGPHAFKHPNLQISLQLSACGTASRAGIHADQQYRKSYVRFTYREVHLRRIPRDVAAQPLWISSLFPVA